MLVVPAVALVLAALLGYLLGHQPARARVAALGNLTLSQLVSIFTGKIRSWSQVSGASASGTIDLESRTSVAGVLLQVPARWHSASHSQKIPGLELNNAAAFAPGGNATDSGLTVGALSSGQPSPLPSALLARLRRQPTTAVVQLQEAQAEALAATLDVTVDVLRCLFGQCNCHAFPPAYAVCLAL